MKYLINKNNISLNELILVMFKIKKIKIYCTLPGSQLSRISNFKLQTSNFFFFLAIP